MGTNHETQKCSPLFDAPPSTADREGLVGAAAEGPRLPPCGSNSLSPSCPARVAKLSPAATLRLFSRKRRLDLAANREPASVANPAPSAPVAVMRDSCFRFREISRPWVISPAAANAVHGAPAAVKTTPSAASAARAYLRARANAVRRSSSEPSASAEARSIS